MLFSAVRAPWFLTLGPLSALGPAASPGPAPSGYPPRAPLALSPMWLSCALLALQVTAPVGPTERAAVQAPGPFDLIVFAGGSNMVGVNLGPREPYPGGADHLPANVFVLDEQDQVAPWHYPLPATWGEAGTAANVTLAYSFLRGYGEQHPDRQVLAIFAGRGGAGINSFSGDPSRSFAGPSSSLYLPGNLFDRLQARIAAAIEQGGVLRALCWHQGESDSGPLGTAAYFDEWQLMWGDLRRGLPPDALAETWPYAERPALIGGLPTFGAAVFPQIAQGQAALEQLGSLPQVGFVTSEGLVDFGDGAHFDTPSCRTFGQRYLQVLATLDNGPAAPDPLVEWKQAGSLPAGRPLFWQQNLMGSGSLAPSYSAALAPFQSLEQHRRADGYFYFTIAWGTGEQVQLRQRSNPLTSPVGSVIDAQWLGGSIPPVPAGLSRSGEMSDVFTLSPGAPGPLGLNLGVYYAPDTATLIDLDLLGLGPNYFLSPTGLPTSSVSILVD